MTTPPKAAIITNKPTVNVSETFIQKSIDLIPEVRMALGGDYLPTYDILNRRELYQPAPPQGLFARVAAKLQKSSDIAGPDPRVGCVAEELQRHGIDVALCHYAIAGSRMLEIAEQAGVALIIHCHGFDVHREEVAIALADRYPLMGAKAKFIIAVSKKMEKRLIELGVPAKKIVVRPCGVEVDKVQPVAAELNPPNFLMVGRLVEKKAPYLSILAFKEVAEAIPEARLRIVGDGPLQEVCHNLAQCLGISSQVDLLGSMSHEATLAEFQRSRVFLQHSIEPQWGEHKGDSEGTPVAVLEASASGLPVIATRHAGICEAVLDGETGYLVEERDVKLMATRMLEIARSPELAARMGAAGRLHMEAHYSMAGYLKTIRELIYQAAGQELA